MYAYLKNGYNAPMASQIFRFLVDLAGVYNNNQPNLDFFAGFGLM